MPPDGEDNASESAVPHLVEAEAVIKNLEERRKSSLDHHWAVPSKIRSLEADAAPTEEGIHEIYDQSQLLYRNSTSFHLFVAVSTCVVESEHTDSQSGRLVKQSCHDSGIDIREDRDPSVITPLSRKTTYSDADILLADNVDFIPPKPVRQQSRTEEDSGGQKKISSVSFSLEENKDGSAEQTSKPASTSEEAEKQAETKKNKVTSCSLSEIY